MSLGAKMEKAEDGIHSVLMQGIRPGTDYALVLPDGTELPDPTSFFQPQGVTGPSRIAVTGEPLQEISR